MTTASGCDKNSEHRQFITIRDEHRRCYSVVSNAMIYDKRLSFAAKGMLTMILALPDTWVFTVSGIASLGGTTQYEVRKLLKELNKLGYYDTERTVADGRFSGMVYTFYENSPSQDNTHHGKSCDAQDQEAQNLEAEIADVEIQNVEKPYAEDFTLLNTNTKENTNIQSNTEIINQTDDDFRSKKDNENYESPACEESELLKNVEQQICYTRLSSEIGRRAADRIVAIIASCMNGKPRNICGNKISGQKLCEVFGRASFGEVVLTYNSLKDKQVQNFTPYFISALYNRLEDGGVMPPVNKGLQESSLDIDAVEEAMLAKYRRA